MIRTSPLAAVALLSLLVLTNRADAQATAPPANPNSPAAIRAARIKAAQAAAAAAAKAPPAATPPPVVTAPPVVTPPTTAATATAAATSSAKPATSAAPATSGSAVAIPKRPEVSLDQDVLKKTRADRRHTEVLALEQRWGGLLNDAHAAAELRLHAQRVAYLQRIRALASQQSDLTLVRSVDALLTKEEIRDSDAMNALRGGALK